MLAGRGVAQPGSALEWGSRGRRFKSSRPDQLQSSDIILSARPPDSSDSSPSNVQPAHLIDILLEDAIDDFLLSKRAENLSDDSISFYEGMLGRIERLVGNTALANVTSADIRQILSYVRHESVRWGGTSVSSRRPAKPITVDAYWRTLSAFFTWAEREALVAPSPMRAIPRPKVPKLAMTIFTPEDIQRLLSLCPANTYLGLRNAAIVRFLLDTGARLEEVTTIQVHDIDLKRGTVKLWGKGSKERLVRMGYRCQRSIRRYLAVRDSARPELFLTAQMEPLQPQGLRYMIRRLATRAGISGVRSSPHTFRHTFAVYYLRSGGDVKTLQMLLGHDDIRMTLRYLTAVEHEDALRAHERHSPVDRLRL